jgi:hypothetical protein
MVMRQHATNEVPQDLSDKTNYLITGLLELSSSELLCDYSVMPRNLTDRAIGRVFFMKEQIKRARNSAGVLLQ